MHKEAFLSSKTEMFQYHHWFGRNLKQYNKTKVIVVQDSQLERLSNINLCSSIGGHILDGPFLTTCHRHDLCKFRNRKCNILVILSLGHEVAKEWDLNVFPMSYIKQVTSGQGKSDHKAMIL
jgi:hypothetical protein